jgi:acyl carrier protein
MPLVTEALPELVVSTLSAACNLDAQTIDLQTGLADIGVDSMIMATLLTFVEAEYMCEFSQQQILQFLQAESVGQLLQELSQAISAAAVT